LDEVQRPRSNELCFIKELLLDLHMREERRQGELPPATQKKVKNRGVVLEACQLAGGLGQQIAALNRHARTRIWTRTRLGDRHAVGRGHRCGSQLAHEQLQTGVGAVPSREWASGMKT
jgi:hypothetical protein